MNWGKGLALVMIAFAGMMAWFVVKAMQNPEPLVTERYYEQELVYQGRINDLERTSALSTAVRMEIDKDLLRLTFPPELHATAITGELTLLRTNDPLADRKYNVRADNDGSFTVADPGLRTGRYNALLTWQANGEPYYTEEKIYVP